MRILATTKMQSAICVAGVDPDNKWVRPVPRDGLNFQADQLAEGGRVVAEPYNEVDFSAIRVLANRPQSEDVEVDPESRPRLVRSLSDNEIATLCAKLDQYEIVSSQRDPPDRSGLTLENFLLSQGHSLILSRVSQVHGASRNYFSGQGKYRIQFAVGDAEYDLPCTDLRWRALARDSGDSAAVAQLAASQRLYFVLGLTRVFRQRYWPMVIGVHPLPRLSAQVDYARL